MPKGKQVAIVPARAGSRGLPGKNLLPINGIPLYRIALDQAARTCDLVVFTTDIEEVFDSELPNNCLLHRRPESLASSSAEMADVVADVLRVFDFGAEIVTLLQPTSPLRIDADIKACQKKCGDAECSMALTVSECDNKILKSGFFEGEKFVGVRNTEDLFKNRQDLPKVYAPNGAVYAFQAWRFREQNHFPCASISIVPMPVERSPDIDTMDDYRFVEQKMKLHANQLMQK